MVTPEVVPPVTHLVYRFPLLALLFASATAAQPQIPAERKLRQRSVTLPARAGEDTLRVARGYVTTLTIVDAIIAPKSVVVQGRDTHFERFVADEHSIVLKPGVELSGAERLMLTMRFADGASPQEATFVLVSAGEEVDASVEVTRRPRTVEALQAELAQTQAQLAALQARCGDGGGEAMYLSGLLDENGVRPRPLVIRDNARVAPALKVLTGMSYRAGSWALVVVQLSNGLGGKPWWPVGARIITTGNRDVRVKSLRMTQPRLGAGETAEVLVETERPWWGFHEKFRLELQDGGGGPPLSIAGISL